MRATRLTGSSRQRIAERYHASHAATWAADEYDRRCRSWGCAPTRGCGTPTASSHALCSPTHGRSAGRCRAARRIAPSAPHPCSPRNQSTGRTQSRGWSAIGSGCLSAADRLRRPAGGAQRAAPGQRRPPRCPRALRPIYEEEFFSYGFRSDETGVRHRTTQGQLDRADIRKPHAGRETCRSGTRVLIFSCACGDATYWECSSRMYGSHMSMATVWIRANCSPSKDPEGAFCWDASRRQGGCRTPPTTPCRARRPRAAHGRPDR